MMLLSLWPGFMDNAIARRKDEMDAKVLGLGHKG